MQINNHVTSFKGIIPKIITLCLFLVVLTPLSHAAPQKEAQLKESAYRLGTTDQIEGRYQIIDSHQQNQVNEIYSPTAATINRKISYSDANLQMLSKEVSQELGVDRDKMFEDISILWDGAVRRSETIKFAIYKLSNPDAEKPDESIVKKIISPLANLTTIAGASMGDPFISTGAFLGGRLFDIFSRDDKELNYKFSKVTDADMIVLVRKIDDLQRNIVNYYCDYICDRNVLLMNTKILEKRKAQYDAMQHNRREELLVMDAYYREAFDRCAKAQTKFLASRAMLEQLVGNDALQKFEASYDRTESGSND